MEYHCNNFSFLKYSSIVHVEYLLTTNSCKWWGTSAQEVVMHLRWEGFKAWWRSELSSWDADLKYNYNSSVKTHREQFNYLQVHRGQLILQPMCITFPPLEVTREGITVSSRLGHSRGHLTFFINHRGGKEGTLAAFLGTMALWTWEICSTEAFFIGDFAGIKNGC